MMAYLSRYIENFSSRCEPLRRLTKKGQPFEWKTDQQAEFDDLRKAITTAPILMPYHLERETMIICDGSPTGLGGGLFQETSHGYQPVHYVSRTLTETESHYSQIEREALAVQFSTNRLQIYLLGSKQFQVATDHKPLLPIFNNPSAKLPPRIERIWMKMQNMDFIMIHITWQSKLDGLSIATPITSHRRDTHRTTRESSHQHGSRAIVINKIREDTSKDKELLALAETIRTGNWQRTEVDLRQYYDMRAEIYEADGILLRGDRIIPPSSLRKRIINVAHNQGHLGTRKTKEIIRNKYWFPSMNQQIENIVQICFNCQIATNTFHTKPAKMTKRPQQPWDQLDFCGPFPSGEYAMVLTDQFSRYPEVEFIRSTATAPIREKLKKIFATHGVPKTASVNRQWTTV